MGDALNRGTTEGADCEFCPFSNAGGPNKPVVSEFPDDPMWIVIGEGPGFNEVRTGRPFVGASGQVVNKILHRIGRPREHLAIVNATLCMPPSDSPVEDREIAAACCKPRLQKELAQWPGKPILTLGAVSARSVIPKDVLDAIDPPDVPKTRKRSQKEKQKAKRKEERKRGKAVDRIARRRYKATVKKFVGDLKHEIVRKYQKRPDKAYLERELNRYKAQFWGKAWKEAGEEYEAKLKEKELARLHPDPNKPRKAKKKPIKITDIVGTLFDVDVDGSGVRPVIPAIHPAALLRGGGASIGGSHTPDMAFVNIMYDAAKCDALAKGKDIRLHPAVEIEVHDQARAVELFISILQEVVDEGSGSLDLETYVDDIDRHHALMAWIARIRVVGIATSKRAVSVAWELLPSWALSYLQLVLGTKPVHYHHGLYDRTVLRAYGFVLPIFGWNDGPEFHDSLYAHHAAFPGNSHRLQTVTAQFFGVGPWKSEFRNAEETPEKLADYNAKDTFATHADVQALTVWVKRTETEKVYAIDRTMCDIASRMHLDGMPVSREINAQLVSTFSRLAKESKRIVDDKANDPKVRDLIKHHLAIQLAAKKRKKDSDEFEARYEVRLADLKDRDWFWNVNNPKHIAALLQAIGVNLVAMTDGGAISTKKDVLESLVDVGIVRDILRYRENDKMMDFVGPIFDREVGGQLRPGFADQDDRIHPIWSIHKISGRWAGSEPFGVSNPPREKPSKPTALIELPSDAIILDHLCHCGKNEKEHKDADHAYQYGGMVIYAARPTTKRQVVARKGRKLVGFDFEQIEARILALLSGDEFMCDVFARNGDIHTECAIDVFPGFLDRTPKERKMMRTVCKTLEYATWYGANDETVWKGLLKEGYNFKLVDTSNSLAILRKKMSGIVRWQRETILAASNPPYTLRGMVLGRRRVWPMGQVDQGEALNIVPQTTGAEIMDIGMAKMDGRIRDREYKQCFPIVQVHDAAVYECCEDDAEKVQADIDDCFEFEWTNPRNGKSVRFPVDSAIADTWADV